MMTLLGERRHSSTFLSVLWRHVSPTRCDLSNAARHLKDAVNQPKVCESSFIAAISVLTPKTIKQPSQSSKQAIFRLSAMHGWAKSPVAACQTQSFVGNYKIIKVRRETHRRFHVRLGIIASCCCSLFVESNLRMSCSCVDDVTRESYNGTSLVADRVWWYHQRSEEKRWEE